MAELESVNRLKAVGRYYEASREGYWDELGGMCHYGYTPKDHEGSFNLRAAQLTMEDKLGRTLDLPAGSLVLDAGCGWGPVARSMTKNFGYRVVGLDSSEERIFIAGRTNKEVGIPVMGFTRGDYQNLPFADNTFDGIYTMETLVHASPLEDALHSFWKALKPGGKLVHFEYTVPEWDSIPYVVRKLADSYVQSAAMFSLPKFSHGSFPRILRDAGFENAYSEDISENVYPSWFHLWKFSITNIAKEFKKGNIGLDSIPGSFWIWPARHQLKYVVSQATKPI